MGGATDDALAGSHDLVAPRNVDAVGAGTILTGHFTDPCIGSQRQEGAQQRGGERFESLFDFLARFCGGNGPGKCDRSRVENGGPSTRQSLDRFVSGRPAGHNGRQVTGADHVPPAEGDDRTGLVQPEALRYLSGCDTAQDHMR